MALKDKKITEAGINQHGVVSAPDHLTGTPTENKKVFDRLVRALVAQSVNGLIDDLAGTGGAEEIGVSPINGLSGSNVQELLAAMKTLLDKRIAEAGVASFKGRTGPVVPQNGDYTAAMVGAAPAGYGLGGTNAYANDRDWDSAINAGFYAADHNSPDGQWWHGIVENYSNAVIVQRAWKAYIVGGKVCTPAAERTGVATDGVMTWEPWEYVNPPMELGKEYRTTERYNGKPVYVRMVNVATLPNNNISSVFLEGDVNNNPNKMRCIDVRGLTSNLYAIPVTCYGGNPEKQIAAHGYSNSLVIHTTFDASVLSANFVVKYIYEKS